MLQGIVLILEKFSPTDLELTLCRDSHNLISSTSCRFKYVSCHCFYFVIISYSDKLKKFWGDCFFTCVSPKQHISSNKHLR